ncbi:MAG: AAA family ATPase [Cryobacterium sp.]|nr:AAA family ATPase [Cryobacterium sp.]
MARVPLIVIRSIERTRSIKLLTSIADEVKQMPFYIHTRTEGLKQLSNGQVISDDKSLAMALDQAAEKFKMVDFANFVFADVDDVEDESPTSRHLAEVARLAEGRSGTIIIISEKPVWTGLGRLGMNAVLDLPTADELFFTLNEQIEMYRGQVEIEWQRDEVRQAADILAGVTETEALNVITTILAKRRLEVADMPKLSEYKDRIFGDLAGLERVRLRDSYKVGGLKSLRDWLGKRAELITADFTGTELRPPKGILLVGVPGCGKSLSAKAIAVEWKLPLYRLDMSSILGMYVGQSESRLKEALETADRVAPCVLWIDEIEKALASGSDGGGSGTTKRLVGQFLYWLQESTSRVFMVATANDIASLPPELTRKGRFDEIFFVDLPDRADREEILRMYFTSKSNYDLPPDLAARLVELTEGFSGAEIDAVINDIATTMFSNHQSTMYPDDTVVAFFENTMPFSRSNPEDLAAIRAWGESRAIPAGTPSTQIGSAKVTAGRRIVVL